MKTTSISLFTFFTILSFGTIEGAQQLRPVATAALQGSSGSGASLNPAFSADGRFVVFVSQANNLVTNDNNSPYLDVCVRDLASSNTMLVSVDATGNSGGNADCNYPSISANGQFIAFASAASNLVPNDANNGSDIFLRDMRAGTTRLVSVDSSGNSPSNPLPYNKSDLPLSGNPLISADGRFVFFETIATNLCLLEDTNRTTDIFLRDMTSETTRQVSVNAASTGTGNGQSRLSSITPDGRWVAFTSRASNLVAGCRGGGQEVFVRDMQSEVTYWASASALLNLEPPTTFYAPVLSTDGRYLYFKKAPVSGAHELWSFDLQTQTVLCIHTNVMPQELPSVCPDGRYLAYAAQEGIYIWDENSQTNRFVDCGAAPSLSLGAGALVYKKTSGQCADSQPGIYVQQFAEPSTNLVSTRLDGTPAYFTEPSVPIISPDGRLVAFESQDGNIVVNDMNRTDDVFIHDAASQITSLVSQRHPERPLLGGTGPSVVYPGCISANGGVLVFLSQDSNLASGDTNQSLDAFSRDLRTGELLPLNGADEFMTNGPFPFRRSASDPVISANGQYLAWTWHYPSNYFAGATAAQDDVYLLNLGTRSNPILVSRNVNGEPSQASSRPALSSDGRLVAFQSTAPGMVPSLMVGSVTNIYVCNVATGTNQLVSISNSGTHGAGPSINPLFSPDDQWIVFQSKGFGLTTNDSGTQYYQLYARNLKTQKTRMVSYDQYGRGLDWDSTEAAFSANSRYVVFTSHYVVYRHDLLASSPNVVVCTWGTWGGKPSISADGRYVVYQTHLPSYSSVPQEVLVKDLLTGEETLISTNLFGTKGRYDHSSAPAISYDGRYVVFLSRATNLVDLPTTGTGDIFVRDRVLGKTLLASVNRQGTAGGDAKSSNPILAADGRTIVFQSFAGDLTEGDYNQIRDIFTLRLTEPDTDGDGIDDGWEIAYFGNLDRDGSGDFDGDGQSDLQEYQAGTDPINQGSILRVFTVTAANSSSVTLLWNATPGRTYQVQYKTNITDAWTDLPGSVVANGTTGSKVDTTAVGTERRFYRVVCQP